MPKHLDTSPRIDDPDAFYDQLIHMHHGLTGTESAKVNARLVLLLANHIGDRKVLEEALALAREDI